MTVGGATIGLAFNARTRTLYVGNEASFISVVDTEECNRTSTAGCSAVPARVATNPGADWPVVDAGTNTVYVPEFAEPSTTLAVIDGRACNAGTTSGCGQTPARVTVGAIPAVAVFDATTRTVYVENELDRNVSVVDATRCNAQDTTGCAQTPPTIQVGAFPNSNLVIDQATRTLFVSNTGSDTISAVDIRDCHAGDASGCARRSPTIQTGNEPYWIDLDPVTGTLFVPEFIDADVAAFDARTCNARRRSGCRDEAPTVAIPDGVWSVAADPDTHTLYAGGGDDGKLTLVDTRRRAVTFEAPLGGTELRDIVLDRATHTLYVADAPVGHACWCSTRGRATCAATPAARRWPGSVPAPLRSRSRSTPARTRSTSPTASPTAHR